jgi:hypothetical protein
MELLLFMFTGVWHFIGCFLLLGLIITAADNMWKNLCLMMVEIFKKEKK